MMMVLRQASNDKLLRNATLDEEAAGEAASKTGIRTGTFLIPWEGEDAINGVLRVYVAPHDWVPFRFRTAEDWT